MQFRAFRRLTFLVLLGAAATIIAILSHMTWPLTLPPPWTDEVHFLIPAISFARHGSLSGARMLTPQIYWMPIGFYLLNGLMFLVSRDFDLQLARTVSLTCVTFAALILRHIVSAALGPVDERRPWLGDLLVLAWYSSLPLVFAADIARPDALALLTGVATLDCVLRGRTVGSCALAALSVVVHPLLALPACAVAAFGLPALRRRNLRNLGTTWWEWLLLAAALLLLAAEWARFATDMNLYRTHWAFQLSRKAGRATGWITKIAAVVSLAAIGFASYTYRADRWAEFPTSPSLRLRSCFVWTFGTVAIFVHSYGQEMWYFPFILTGSLLITCTIIGNTRAMTSAQHAGGLAAAAAMVAVCVATLTWGLGFRPRGIFRFHVSPSFIANVAADLGSTASSLHDALGSQRARTVLVDPTLYYSFLGQLDGAAVQAYTWNPLSRTTDVRFDHFVIVKDGYPSVKTILPTTIASDYVCLSERDLATRDGRFVVGIMTVEYRPSAGREFSPCTPSL